MLLSVSIWSCIRFFGCDYIGKVHLLVAIVLGTCKKTQSLFVAGSQKHVTKTLSNAENINLRPVGV